LWVFFIPISDGKNRREYKRTGQGDTPLHLSLNQQIFDGEITTGDHKTFESISLDVDCI